MITLFQTENHSNWNSGLGGKSAGSQMFLLGLQKLNDFKKLEKMCHVSSSPWIFSKRKKRNYSKTLRINTLSLAFREILHIIVTAVQKSLIIKKENLSAVDRFSIMLCIVYKHWHIIIHASVSQNCDLYITHQAVKNLTSTKPTHT